MTKMDEEEVKRAYSRFWAILERVVEADCGSIEYI